MSDAAVFKATYSDFRLIKGRKVVQFVFELPLEQADIALKAVGGMPNPAAEVWCAIARLNPETERQMVQDQPSDQPGHRSVLDTPPASGPDIQARARKPVDPDKRMARRAGILCNDPLFQRYLAEKHNVSYGTSSALDNHVAANFIRKFCEVDTRADIKPNTEAALRWNLLESAFVGWRDVPEYADA